VRRQHAADFAQGRLLVGEEHQAQTAEHAIETGSGEGQGLAVGGDPRQVRTAGELSFADVAGDHQPVRSDRGAGAARQQAGAAGQVEHALARFELRRGEQGGFRREFAARARGSQVARAEPVVAGALQALELLRIETHGNGACGRAAAALSRSTLYTASPTQIAARLSMRCASSASR
jgi:hypothetical protein